MLSFLGIKLISKNKTSGNRTSVGIVEVYEDGKWKQIWDKNWTMADSDVTCKDLGFIGAIENFSLQYITKEHKTLSNKDYQCSGRENYLSQCLRNHVDTRLACTNVAGTRCKNEGIYVIY